LLARDVDLNLEVLFFDRAKDLAQMLAKRVFGIR
jgi:hypothetical protein